MCFLYPFSFQCLNCTQVFQRTASVWEHRKGTRDPSPGRRWAQGLAACRAHRRATSPHCSRPSPAWSRGPPSRRNPGAPLGLVRLLSAGNSSLQEVPWDSLILFTFSQIEDHTRFSWCPQSMFVAGLGRVQALEHNGGKIHSNELLQRRFASSISVSKEYHLKYANSFQKLSVICLHFGSPVAYALCETSRIPNIVLHEAFFPLVYYFHLLHTSQHTENCANKRMPLQILRI